MKIAPFVILTCATLGAVQAQAQAEAGTPERCATVENGGARLACYDAIYRVQPTGHTPAPAAATAPAPAAPPIRSDWHVQTTRSEIDDSRRVVLSVHSDAPIRGRFGSPGLAAMIVRCEQNTTSIYFNFNGLFMADIQSYGRVDFRVDDRAARHVSMNESTNHEALGLWRGGTAIPFLRDIFGGERLFVRVTPFSESRVDMTFNIAGLEEAIAPLREACHW